MKAKIVGIDPGTTIGIVSIDEDGNIDFHYSGKNLSTEEIVEIIKKIEGVVLISTDKHKTPKKIIEIASKLNLGIYCPKKDIPLNKKKKFYSNEKIKNILKDIHEIDAYISAYFALVENKDIFRKAKKISKDYKEYIEILKVSFKNRNLEPFSALEIIRNNDKKEEIIIKKKKIRKKRKLKIKAYDNDINILSEFKNNINDDEKYTKIVKEYSEKYISLLNDYNIISKILVSKLTENSEIIPKISFLIKNNIKSPLAFIDIIDESIFTYISKCNPKIFVTEDKKDFVIKSQRKIFIVKEYIELRNFIIIKKFEEYSKNFEENIDTEKIKKLIDSLRDL